MKNVIIWIVVLSVSVSLSHAASVEFVTNGSFEAGVAIDTNNAWGTFGTLADNWTYVSGDASLRTDGGSGDPWYGRVADDGTVFVGIKSNPGHTSIMQQQLKSLVMGEIYAVNFSTTLDAYSSSESSGLKVYIGSTLIYDIGMKKYGWYRTGSTWPQQFYVANAADGSNPILKFVHSNDVSNANGHYMLFDKVSVFGTAPPQGTVIVVH